MLAQESSEECVLGAVLTDIPMVSDVRRSLRYARLDSPPIGVRRARKTEQFPSPSLDNLALWLRVWNEAYEASPKPIGRERAIERC